MRFATLATVSELACARTLAASIARHHRDSRLTVLLLDDHGRRVTEEEPFDVVRPGDLAGVEAELWAVGLPTAGDFREALKPHLLRHILSCEQAPVVLLDPTVYVLAPLEELEQLARRSGLVPVPRAPELGSAPEALGARLAAGPSSSLDSGVLAVGSSPASYELLDRWCADVVKFEPRGAQAGGPSLTVNGGLEKFFPDALLGCKTALSAWASAGHWNLAGRRIERRGGLLVIEEQIVLSFNFRGFDPTNPYWLSSESAIVRLSEYPALIDLCREYAQELLDKGHRELSGVSYGCARLDNGIELDEEVRSLYIRAVSERAPIGAPFTPEGAAAFVSWLNEPEDGFGYSGASRYLLSLYQRRPDLRRSFPNLQDGDGPRLVQWAHSSGCREDPMLALVMDVQARGESSSNGSPSHLEVPGVNVYGYLRDGLGLGEAARLYTAALAEAGSDVSTCVLEAPEPQVDYGPGYDPVPKRVPFAGHRDGGRHPINLLCINPPEMMELAERGRPFPRATYTIGVWAWEARGLPEEWWHAHDMVDEVWAYSTYVADNLGRAIPKPVVRVPLPIMVNEPSEVELGLDLPDEFLFLFCFDHSSTLLRKNPLGLIEAFKRAFDPGEGPRLLVKSMNGDYWPDAQERVRVAALDRPDIDVVDCFLDGERKNALLARCDCFVSLHRAEGFGLLLGEAMALGKPVIATGYSGNMDFMKPANSFLVDYTLAEVGPHSRIYPRESVWAEPDLDQAASLMRQVWKDRSEAARRAARGRADIKSQFSLEATAAVVRERLEQLARSGALPAERRQHGPFRASATAAPPDWTTPQPFDLQAIDARTPLRRLVRRVVLRTVRPFGYHQEEFNHRVAAAFEHLGHQLAAPAGALAPARPPVEAEGKGGTWTATGERSSVEDEAPRRRTIKPQPRGGKAVGPSLSVVVATIEPWPEIETFMEAVYPQIRATGGELIVADGHGAGLSKDFESRYPGVVQVTDRGASVFSLRFQAAALARGAVIAMTEDHCLPALDWCEAIIRSHREHPDVAAIGGAVENGSPGTSVDWANFLVTFGAFVPPVEPRQRLRVPPPANIAFKRTALEHLSNGPGWIEFELSPRLFEAGEVIVDDRVRVAHVQPVSLGQAFMSHFRNGRSTTGLTAPFRSPGERGVIAGDRAAHPVRVFRTTWRSLRGKRSLRFRKYQCLPALALLSGSHRAGEIAGAITGSGRSASKLH